MIHHLNLCLLIIATKLICFHNTLETLTTCENTQLKNLPAASDFKWKLAGKTDVKCWRERSGVSC